MDTLASSYLQGPHPGSLPRLTQILLPPNPLTTPLCQDIGRNMDSARPWLRLSGPRRLPSPGVGNFSSGPQGQQGRLRRDLLFAWLLRGKSGSANQRLGAEPGIVGLRLPSGLTVSGRASRRVEMLRHSKLQPTFLRAHSSLDAGPLSL